MRKIFLLLLFTPMLSFAQVNSCDILIKNGKIIDGTGNNWHYGDIAIKNGRIIKMGKGLTINAQRTIDATGLIVAPGFIDVHTHLEGDEDKDPKATSFIMDGV